MGTARRLRDPKGVVSCLDRAARFARECMDTAVRTQLFIDILNLSVNLRISGCHEVSPSHEDLSLFLALLFLFCFTLCSWSRKLWFSKYINK
ncbi:unnamed protein product [Trichobilharzia regenti]|nr:unnamed protein product [Trichobilharzia regenti]